MQQILNGRLNDMPGFTYILQGGNMCLDDAAGTSALFECLLDQPGLEPDYEHLIATRPEIAAMLRCEFTRSQIPIFRSGLFLHQHNI